MFVDFVLNDQLQGPIADQIGMPGNMRFDPGLFRPFINRQGVKCVTINTGHWKFDDKLGREVPELKTFAVRDLQRRGIDIPTWNTTTSLRKEQWIAMDRAIKEAALPRLRLVQDLQNSVSYGGFDAMAHMTLEYEAISTPGEALVSMDGLAEGRNDRPQYSRRSTPLPITHSDFQMSARLLAVSRNGGIPLDTTMGRRAGRVVAERIEKMAIGVETGVEWGTVTTGPFPHTGLSKEYGLINFPYRMTKTDLTTPTGLNPDATVDDVLEMRTQMYDANHFGPYVIYHSTDWDEFLDNDYVFATGTGLTSPTMTLRQRLLQIEGITAVRRLDYLTPAASHAFTMVMLELNTETVEFIDGMRPTLIQWTEKGGMELRFKLMAIQTTRFKHDFYNSTGVVHARTA